MAEEGGGENPALIEALDRAYITRKRTILSTTGAGAFTFALAMMNEFSYFVLAWFIALLLYTWANYAVIGKYLSIPPAQRNLKYWENIFLLSFVLLGLMWASMALYFEFYGPESSKIIVFILIFFFASGTYIPYAYIRYAGTVFSLTVFTPIIALHLYQGGPQNIMLASILVIYFIFLQMSGAQLYSQLMETMETSRRNRDLVRILDDANKALEREMAAAREAKAMAENATKLKDQFVSIVSHDLRSPLSGIVGALEMAKDPDRSGIDRSTVQDIVNSTFESAKNLYTLVEKLLDISRLQTGDMAPRMTIVHTRAFLEDPISRYGPIAGRKDIRIINIVPESHLLFADEGLMAEVVSNLLSNAVKFLPMGGQITIFAPDNRNGQLAVKDTGPGIPQEFAKDLFSHQVKTTSAGAFGETGSGLGLPHSADIVRAHNGRLYFESTEGAGSVFFINLPFPESLSLSSMRQTAHLEIIK